jgi:hypothetical protein
VGGAIVLRTCETLTADKVFVVVPVATTVVVVKTLAAAVVGDEIVARHGRVQQLVRRSAAVCRDKRLETLPVPRI